MLFGLEIPGIPMVVGDFLETAGCAPWLPSLILDGIVTDVGAMLGFASQMLVLFILSAFLESCGYMTRVVFIMGRIPRKSGLSDKSFIPTLIGTERGIPDTVASRIVKNDRDREMTIMTTMFVPRGTELSIVTLFTDALLGGASWMTPDACFVGTAAVICTDIILKETRVFAGNPAPFIMGLPIYHLPTVPNVLRGMWERG